MSDPISADWVRNLFRDHWRAPREIPAPFWHEHIAAALRVIRDRQPPTPPEPLAIKYASLFRHHAPALLAQLHAEAGGYAPRLERADGSVEETMLAPDRHARCIAALEALEAAERAVAAALTTYNGRTPLVIEDQDPARFLHRLLHHAWESVGGDIPRSINEGDPLCQFIAAALEKAGVRVGQGRTKGGEYTAAAISAVLTGQTKRLNFVKAGSGQPA